MTTFSELVDDLAKEHLRPDLLTVITAYANQTVRELHSQRNTAAPILFASNRKELQFSVATQPVTWDIPSVARFQRLEAVYYKEQGVYVDEKSPRRAFDSPAQTQYWYRTGAGIQFSGIDVGETVQLTYFEFPRNLVYYADGQRPATYNPEDESFTYHADYAGAFDLREKAKDLTTHWILQRWPDTVKQGVRAKVFGRLGDDTRAKMMYSAFEALRESLNTSETFQQGVIK